MLEIIYNTVAVIGFGLILLFAFIGFKFVLKAFAFAAELSLLEWKYEKAKKVANNEVAVMAFNKIKKDGQKDSENTNP